MPDPPLLTGPSASDLHHAAMTACDASRAARARENVAEARDLAYRAFVLESRAATQFADRPDCEPTRSVLYRSAAYLALDAGLPDEAVRMARAGLEGRPAGDIADELKEVLTKAKGSIDA